MVISASCSLKFGNCVTENERADRFAFCILLLCVYVCLSISHLSY